MGNLPSIDLNKIRYVFLDRDGVLNRKPPAGGFVTCCEGLELLDGVAEGVAALNRSGRKVIVATNQRGIALGLFSADDLARIHALLQARLAASGAHLDAIYVCPHDRGQCGCRKPLPGLFEQAFRDFPDAKPENSLMAGDSLRDIEAGVRLGMKTAFISAGNSNSDEDRRARQLANICAGSLAELVHQHFGCVIPSSRS